MRVHLLWYYFQVYKTMSENQQIEVDEDSKWKIETMKDIASSLDEERPGNLSTPQKTFADYCFRDLTKQPQRHRLLCIL